MMTLPRDSVAGAGSVRASGFPPMQTGWFHSKDKTHRYALWYSWQKSEDGVQFLPAMLLNPGHYRVAEYLGNSGITVAKAARELGYSGVLLLNVFSLVAPGAPWLPKDATILNRQPDADWWIEASLKGQNTVLLGWGADTRVISQMDRLDAFLSGKELLCLGLTRSGMPYHPAQLNHPKIQAWERPEYWIRAPEPNGG